MRRTFLRLLLATPLAVPAAYFLAEPLLSSTPAAPGEVPLIDRDAPAKVETATFALG
jgi:hypothetical protein